MFPRTLCANPVANPAPLAATHASHSDIGGEPVCLRADVPIPVHTIVGSSLRTEGSGSDRSTPITHCHQGISIDPVNGVPAATSPEDIPSPPPSEFCLSPRQQLAVQFASSEGLTGAQRALTMPKITAPVYYFECTIVPIESGQNVRVAIGLVPLQRFEHRGTLENHLPGVFPGDLQGSIGYSSEGVVRKNGEVVATYLEFGMHDTVGCGLEVGGQGRVIFTCNGKLMGVAGSGFGLQGQSYLPAIGVQGFGTSVEMNFGDKEFAFSDEELEIVRVPTIHQQAQQLTERTGNRHLTQAAQLASVESQLVALARMISLSEADVSTVWSAADQTEIENLVAALDELVERSQRRSLRLTELMRDRSITPPSSVSLEPHPQQNSFDLLSPPSMPRLDSTLSEASSADESVRTTMETLAHKLRALQAKLRRALESATEETSLAALVALNDSVSQVLARAEIYFVVENTDTDECMEPSVLQLIYIIRRGKAEDSLQALEALIRTSLSKPETRKDIVSCGGLHTLTSIMSSSTYSGAMEIYTPLAVMLLVPMEHNHEALLSNAQEILSAMQLLLLNPAEQLEPVLSSFQSSCGAELDMRWVKREVAVALGQMSLALQGAADPQMDDLNDLPPVMGPLTRMNSGTRSKAPAFDTKKILESVINLVHMLSGCSALPATLILRSNSDERLHPLNRSGRLPNPPMVTCEQSFAPVNETAVLCASAIANLAENPSCRARLVANGVLPLIGHWSRWVLREAAQATELLEASKEGFQAEPFVESDRERFDLATHRLSERTELGNVLSPLHIELLTYTTAALASLVSRTDADRDYDRGWIASQTMAERNVHVLLELALLPYWLPIYIQRNIASILNNLASASQQNIDQLLKLHATQALVSMILQSVSQQEQENQRTSRVRLIADVLLPSLNALYLFLSDVPPSDALMFDDECNPVVLVTKPAFLSTLCVVLSQQRSPVCFAAVRVLSMLSQWPVLTHLLFDALLFEPLFAIISEIYLETNGNIPSDSSITSSGGHTPPASGRGHAADKRSKYAQKAPPAVESSSKRDEEEYMWCIVTLANLCEFGTGDQVRHLVEKGSIHIILQLKARFAVNDVIEHQTVRCIASMSAELLRVASKPRPNRAHLTSCARVLRTLALAVKSTSPLDQMQALKGLLVFAADERFQQYLVEGPMRNIVRVVIDSNTEIQIRQAGEHLLRALGFVNGIKDLELCGNDSHLLAEWFRMERSLRPQEQAQECLLDWWRALWDRNFTRSDIQLQKLRSLPEMLDQAWARPLDTSLERPPYSKSTSHDATSISSPTRAEHEKGGLASLSEAIHPHADRFLRFLQSVESWRSITTSWKQAAHGNAAAAATHASPGTPNLKHGSGATGRGAPGPLTPEGFLRHLLFDYGPTAKRRGSDATQQDINRDLDAIESDWGEAVAESEQQRAAAMAESADADEVAPALPLALRELMDLFFLSWLEQMKLTQMLDVGYWVDQIATPRLYRGLLMPERNYLSFRREGRVIERLLGTHAAKDARHGWCIVFKGCRFDGEFYVTLLSTIQRCSQIRSLTFAGSHMDSDDTRMGHMAGNLPATVRHLTFENSLPSNALQVFCLLLRRNNPSFQDGSKRRSSGGLQGLAITGHAGLSNEDINHILLLLPAPGDDADEDAELAIAKSKAEARRRSSSVDTIAKYDEPKASPGKDMTRLATPGLRWLDLSRNQLRESQCIQVLQTAAQSSSLIALDLSGNSVGRGNSFKDELAKLLQSDTPLRHLGLASMGLTSKCVQEIFKVVTKHGNLTSLILSDNALAHADDLKNAFRSLLRSNRTLRILGLSGNRLTDATAKGIELGLVENETMLYISLRNNHSIQHETLASIAERLRANREAYVADITLPQAETKSEFLPSEPGTPIPHQATADARPAPMSVSTAVPRDSKTFLIGSPEVKGVSAEAWVVDDELNPIRSPEQTLYVLFSAPLVWQDRFGRHYPIQMLDYETEREILWQVFQESQRDISLRFDFATTEKLRTFVTLGCRALHFSGHGHPECLNFEDGQGGLQFVVADTLRSLCSAGVNQLEFVFVSACYSRRAGEAFAAAGVAHVVCVNIHAQIMDSTAMAFTRAFYLALALGNTVRQSFEIGRQAVFASPFVADPEAEKDKFLLLPEDSDHDVPIFEAPSSRLSLGGSYGVRQENPNLAHLARPPEDFLGREVDMYRVISMLQRRRLVTLCGESGVGKTAVATAVCEYVAEREMYRDGVIFVKLQGVVTQEEGLHQIRNALRNARSFMPSRLQRTGSAYDVEDRESQLSDEDYIVQAIGPARCLLVLDHVEDLLASRDGPDLRVVMARLFEQCKHLKILATSTGPIVISSAAGVREMCVDLKGLSLRDSLRLFARLTPYILTAEDKLSFVQSLIPPGAADCTRADACSPVVLQIFEMLAGGHPGSIVNLACDLEAEKVAEIRSRGIELIRMAIEAANLHQEAG